MNLPKEESKRYYETSSYWSEFRNRTCYLEKQIEYIGSEVIICNANIITGMHEAFNVLMPFVSSIFMYYVKDNNERFNGRFYVATKDGMALLGRFKDSKIIGDVYMKNLKNRELRILPLDDKSLHVLSDEDIFARLKRSDCKTEETKIMNLVGERFVFEN